MDLILVEQESTSAGKMDGTVVMYVDGKDERFVGVETCGDSILVVFAISIYKKVDNPKVIRKGSYLLSDGLPLPVTSIDENGAYYMDNHALLTFDQIEKSIWVPKKDELVIMWNNFEDVKIRPYSGFNESHQNHICNIDGSSFEHIAPQGTIMTRDMFKDSVK
jgi:hypothetical protein